MLCYVMSQDQIWQPDHPLVAAGLLRMLWLLSLQQGVPGISRAPANELKAFDTPETDDGMCPGHPHITRTSPNCQKKLDSQQDDGPCPGHPNIKRKSPHCPEKLDAQHSQEDTSPATKDTSAAEDVEFVVVASSPRSASTSVAEEIADHKCSISFNEVLSGRPGDLFHPQGMPGRALGCIYPRGQPCDLLPGCGPMWWQRRNGNRVVTTLKAMRARYCARVAPQVREQCGGKCVVALKLFRDHIHPAGDPALGGHHLESLFSYEGTRVVVVERDPNDEECSYNYSRASGQWHATNKQIESQWKRGHCHELASPQFTQTSANWYSLVRSTLKNVSKKARYLELPFATFVADVPAARKRLRALAGLPDTSEFDQPACRKTPGKRMAANAAADAAAREEQTRWFEGRVSTTASGSAHTDSPSSQTLLS